MRAKVPKTLIPILHWRKRIVQWCSSSQSFDLGTPGNDRHISHFFRLITSPCPEIGANNVLFWSEMYPYAILQYCKVFHCIIFYILLSYGIAWYCIVLHCIVWYLMLSYGIQFHCTVLHAIALVFVFVFVFFGNSLF